MSLRAQRDNPNQIFKRRSGLPRRARNDVCFINVAMGYIVSQTPMPDSPYLESFELFVEPALLR